MLNALRFVRGSINKQTLLPEFQFVAINNKRIYANDGLITLSSPFDVDFNACPQGMDFVRAVNALSGDPTVTKKNNKLELRSGKTIIRVPCIDDHPLGFAPTTGVYRKFPGPVLERFARLFPFIGVDASRPWSHGIFSDARRKRLLVTNNINIVATQGAIGSVHAVIPRRFVAEILRLKIEPELYAVDGNTLTFTFPEKRWAKCSLIDPDWPDVTDMFKNVDWGGCRRISPEVIEAIKFLTPLVDTSRIVYFTENRISTEQTENSGTTIDVEHNIRGAFNVDQLKLAFAVGTKFNFSASPVGYIADDSTLGIVIGLA